MRVGWRRHAHWLVYLTLIVTLAGCASLGSGTSSQPPAQATATAAAALQGFICANPPESSAMYAFVDAKGQLFVTQGCAAPTPIAPPAGRALTPIAFSSNQNFLLVWNTATDTQAKGATACLALVDLARMTLTKTSAYCNPAGPNGAPSTTPRIRWYSPIAWASDDSFYLAETSASAGAAVTVVFVSLPGLAAVPVTTIPWVANLAHADVGGSGFALAGGALYYAGYRSTSEGGAWLHRFLLSTRMDTRVVRLGVAGSGACQVKIAPCRWTGPWDISSDGAAIAYHTPGPRQSLSASAAETGTPLMLATSAGAHPTQLFPGVSMGQGFAAPLFSPGGAFVAAMVGQQLVTQDIDNGAVTEAPSGLRLQSWTSDPNIALVEESAAQSSPPVMALYNAASGSLTPLQPGAHDFIWA